MKSVPFDVVQIYDNHCTYAPYTLKPIDENHTVLYAVKIGNDFFPLGGKEAVFICVIMRRRNNETR